MHSDYNAEHLTLNMTSPESGTVNCVSRECQCYPRRSATQMGQTSGKQIIALLTNDVQQR